MVRDMTARRNRRAKLLAMAKDKSSPHEAAIARELLEQMGDERADFEDHEFIMPWGQRVTWRATLRRTGKYVGPPFDE